MLQCMSGTWAASSARPPRILIVDDEAGARGALVEFFEEEGFDVRGVGDAYKAIGRVDGWHPDVVLTDLAMPGMDGLTLLAKLRVKVPTLPVILMTAYGTVDDAVEAHTARWCVQSSSLVIRRELPRPPSSFPTSSGEPKSRRCRFRTGCALTCRPTRAQVDAVNLASSRPPPTSAWTS